MMAEVTALTVTNAPDRDHSARLRHPTIDDDASRREVHEKDRRDVVALARSDEHRDEQHRIGERQRAQRLRLVAAPEPQKSGAPDGKQQGPEQKELERDELGPVLGAVLSRDRTSHVDLRPSVGRLPDEVRAPDEHRERGADEEPLRAEDVGSAADHDPDPERRHQEQDEVLVEEPDADDEPDDDPEARIGSLKEARHQPQHEHPRQDVEGGGAQDVSHREEDGSDCAAHRGEDARPRRAPEVPAERRREHDERHADEHRRHAQGARRRAEHSLRDVPEQRGEGWLVDVAPCEVVAGFDEVELVAMEAVAVRGGQQDDAERRRDPTDREVCSVVARP